MHTVYLSLGSNQGDSYEALNKAVQLLFEQVGRIVKISSIYQSKAWGFEAPDFLNCVVKLECTLTLKKLLYTTQQIEMQLGRKQKSSTAYESRIIDIDILLYDDVVKESTRLTIPHLHILDRNFVLLPLAELEGDAISPVFKTTFTTLLEACSDKSILTKYREQLKYPQDTIKLNSYNYIAIEGNIGAGKTSLATMIAKEFNAKLILERFKDNPFLPKFYKEPDRYAFPLEMSFLADRYQQLLNDIGQYHLFKDFMCADYDRYKSLIFAQVTLQEEEFLLYKRLHEMMYRDVAQPDLYIYLYQNTERLLSNIKKRGRSYETSIQPEYLEKINQGYLDFIKSQHNLNVKIIDISQLDFVKNRKDFLTIIRQLGGK